MSSNRSINNQITRGALAIAALLTIGSIETGCAKKVVRKTPAPQPVMVRLADLVAVHPLQVRLDELARIENGLRQSAAQTKNKPGLTQFILPALPLQTRLSVSPDKLIARQQILMDDLGRLAVEQRNTFLAQECARRGQLAQQRETELRGQLITDEISIEKSARERIYQEILDRLRGLDGSPPITLQAAIVRSRLAILRGQLENPEIPLPVLDEKKLPAFDGEAERIVQEEIERLERDPKAIGISQRARLKQRSDKQEALLLDLREKIAKIKADGEAKLAAIQKTATDERESKIASELERFKADEGLQDALIKQETAITDAAKQLRQTTTLSLNRLKQQGTVAAPITYSALASGTPPETSLANSLQLSADRIARQRQQLTIAMERTIQNRVRDIAAARNLDVLIVTANSGVSGRRTDKTAMFAQLIRSGNL